LLLIIEDAVSLAADRILHFVIEAVR